MMIKGNILAFSEWAGSLPSAAAPVCMAGHIFLGRQPLGKSFGLSPFLQWLCWRFTSVAGVQQKFKKLQKLTPHLSTVKQFTTSTVSTSLVSSTEPIALATFPKVVICNKYQLRYGMHLLSSKSYSTDVQHLLSTGNHSWTLWLPIWALR